MCTGLRKRKDRVVSLSLTAPPLMANAKVEDVVFESACRSGVVLGSTVTNSHEQEDIAKKSLYILYNVLIQELLEAVEQSVEDIREGAHAVIGDPLYKTSRIAELPNSEQDRLVLQDMSNVVVFLLVMMDLGAHSPMFCFALQFKSWFELLVRTVEE